MNCLIVHRKWSDLIKEIVERVLRYNFNNQIEREVGYYQNLKHSSGYLWLVLADMASQIKWASKLDQWALSTVKFSLISKNSGNNSKPNKLSSIFGAALGVLSYQNGKWGPKSFLYDHDKLSMDGIPQCCSAKLFSSLGQ